MGISGGVVTNNKPWPSNVAPSAGHDSVEEEVFDAVSESVSLSQERFSETSSMRDVKSLWRGYKIISILKDQVTIDTYVEV